MPSLTFDQLVWRDGTLVNWCYLGWNLKRFVYHILLHFEVARPFLVLFSTSVFGILWVMPFHIKGLLGRGIGKGQQCDSDLLGVLRKKPK